MRKGLLGLFITLLMSFTAHANNGLISIKSSHDVSTTADKLIAVLKEKNMTTFARIKHSEAAENVGIELRPTELILFGNPKVGSPLMACQQSVGIDLPQKALISEDEHGLVWFTYNDPNYLKERHNITGCDEALAKIAKALNMFATKATQP
ncbi:DUF302 domain-containing protein [Vibrio breoganii]|uniref:DUF302 domain-containing protein n=1 Tax=Vibrio breoganii TaxID=553239 RepID=UPI000C827CD6|nr:DUF302 domain-containing protein [Vibrio breoganii]PMK31246.1 hypothetical protein BCU03_07465 [Vibrio breoganii]PML38796.1 hypothetical protein BCT77_13080 [Vibrio breoganii]PMM89412.1 hypothetical protein BCT44_17400 [Vibrio breoganii]PMO73115.1 hypothetical protein BCT02_01705 [Vibrio breoganii]PMO84717.1 hypothetical protein BCS99_15840 [Vibrio breoganii]